MTIKRSSLCSLAQWGAFLLLAPAAFAQSSVVRSGSVEVTAWVSLTVYCSSETTSPLAAAVSAALSPLDWGAAAGAPAAESLGPARRVARTVTRTSLRDAGVFMKNAEEASLPARGRALGRMGSLSAGAFGTAEGATGRRLVRVWITGSGGSRRSSDPVALL